jgi:hypothetical protein
MKNKIIFGMLFIFTLVIAISCEKDDKWKDFQKFDSTYPVCGQYSVSWTLAGVPQGDPTILSVYNSSKGDGIWIDDNKHFWSFKVKANLSGSNFSVYKGFDEYYDDSTTITKGSVTTKTGTNSLGEEITYEYFYMEIEWASSPGDVFICQGRRQTGFEE